MIHRQFAIFLAVGIICAIIDVGVMQFLIKSGQNYLLATTIGFAIGLATNFCLHTRFTFSSTYSHTALVRFLVVVVANYLLTVLIVTMLQVWFNMPLFGKVLSLPIIAINGFLLSKYWVYK